MVFGKWWYSIDVYEYKEFYMTLVTKNIFAVCLTMALFAMATTVFAAPPQECEEDYTTVKGHCGKDSGTVVGNYESYYAEDANGDYYWDLGDGRIYKTVDSVEDLDQATLSECDYKVHYKGDFGDDPFLDMGVIQNMIHCYGYGGNSTYNYQIVSEDDPRYTGNPEYAIWGTWEYHVNTESGVGNLVRPTHAI